MKKHILLMALPVALLAGCGTTGDSSFLSALTQFSSILEGTTPFVQESEEWEQYSIDKTAQGVTYSAANATEKQFVARKVEAEYPAAIDRVSRPFALSEKAKRELDETNKGYHFQFNQVMTVKDKKTSKTLGYCVNFDVNRWVNGKPTSWDMDGNVQQGFMYVATDKALSISTVGQDFIKRMCGNDFYTRYKNPND